MNDRSRDTQPDDRQRTRGATAVEYALMVALIAGIIIGAVGLLGTKTHGFYQTTDAEMVNAGL